MRGEIAEQRSLLEEAETRASTPHRERQVRLVRSLGRKPLDVHDEWIDESSAYQVAARRPLAAPEVD
jgi:hypothetical protein